MPSIVKIFNIPDVGDSLNIHYPVSPSVCISNFNIKIPKHFKMIHNVNIPLLNWTDCNVTTVVPSR